MQMLAMQENQLATEQAYERDQLQQQESVAMAQSKQASSDAGVGGNSSAALMRDIRKQRLNGITTLNINASNFQAQQMAEARGIRATAESKNNALQWASPGAAIASGTLNAAGALAGGLASDVGGGDTLASAIGKKLS